MRYRIRRRDRMCPAPGIRAMTGRHLPAIAAATARVRPARTPAHPARRGSDPRYRRALFYLLACETSCYRYWGQGIWTDYGAELARGACEAAISAT